MKFRYRITTILFTLLSLSVLVSLFFPQLFPFTQKEVAEWMTSYEQNKILFVFIQIFQVIIPPISHYFTSLLGGYVYGPIEGGILNYLGRVLGQFIAFYMSYKYAEKLRENYKYDMSRFEKIVKGTPKTLFVRAAIIFTMIALPFFPDDELTYFMGFSRFDIKSFAIVTIFGHLLGSFALAFLGSGEEFTGPLFIILSVATILCLIGLIVASIYFRRNIGSMEAEKKTGDN